MRPHPYLRAYMAGIVVPTLALLVTLTVYTVASYFLEPSRFVFALPVRPLARALVFPVALVPSIWGVWNMLYTSVQTRVGWSLGVHGALLPLLLMPGGILLARAFDVFSIPIGFALPVFPIGMALYYLVWKYVVGFLNREMGIA
jgi:hypothetical protein